MTFFGRVFSYFVKDDRDMFGERAVMNTNWEKRRLHRQSRFYLHEARRALSSAQAERYMKNEREYEAWALNAVEMLIEADSFRETARELKWRDV